MTGKFVQIADKFYVAPQLSAQDLAAAGALGVTLVINNRPDGEEPFQPETAELARAARAAGLDYVDIPVTSAAAIADADIAAFADAAEGAKGAVLAFCRSGTRSAVLRALARASKGDAPGALIAEAAQAGYDIRGLRPRLEAAAAQSGRGRD